MLTCSQVVLQILVLVCNALIRISITLTYMSIFKPWTNKILCNVFIGAQIVHALVLSIYFLTETTYVAHALSLFSPPFRWNKLYCIIERNFKVLTKANVVKKLILLTGSKLSQPSQSRSRLLFSPHWTPRTRSQCTYYQHCPGSSFRPDDLPVACILSLQAAREPAETYRTSCYIRHRHHVSLFLTL